MPATRTPSKWRDGYDLAHALRCIGRPRSSEVLAALRRSRLFRRRFLADARGMLAFKLSKILAA